MIAAKHPPSPWLEKLRDAESSFGRVVDAIDDHAIFMIARDGTIMTWNHGAQRMKGYSPDEIIGKPYNSLFDDDAHGPTFARGILAAAADQGSYRGEGWRRRKNGSRFFAAFTLHAVRGDAGEVIGFAKITRDISEQHHAAIQLAESERAYRLIADNSSDIIARIGLDGRRHFVSPACHRIFGYTPAEMVAANPLGDLHPDDRVRVEQGVRTLLEGAQSVVLRYRQQHRNGHYVWMETSYQPVVDPRTGETIEIIAVARDISRHHDFEREAAATAARLEEHVRLLAMAEQAVQLGHWRLNVRDNAIFWSDQVFRIHGMMPGAAPDLDVAIAAYHPDDREMVERLMAAALTDGTPFAFRARLTRPDGTVAHVASRGQVTRAPDGTIVDLIGTFQDISDHVASETLLSAALDEAKVAERAKADFLAKMSHEIRTPMTGVLGMIELLRAEQSGALRNKLFATLDRSTRTLMRVLDDVLDYSQAQAGEIVIAPTPFDLRSVVEASVDLFRHDARAKKLDLTLLFPDAPAQVIGDAGRLQQILFNLLGNAIKFTVEGGITIDVTECGDAAGGWTFRITDTGIGLPDTVEAVLFRPFAQADATIARRFGGTGLGLAISRNLAEAMGGTLCTEPVSSHGACFRLDLPFAPVATSLSTAEPDQPAPARLRDILVAEDHPANMLLLETWLRRQGHRVRCVTDGRQAVEAVAGGDVDVVLMDLQMPEMDGIAASIAIRRLPDAAALTPIVALSADVLSHHDHALNLCGVSELLAKPVDFDRLAAVLDAIPDRKRRHARIVDPERLTALFALMTGDDRARFLAMIEDELRDATARLVEALRLGDETLAAGLAHRSIGALENVGAEAQVALLRPIADRQIYAPGTIAAVLSTAAATRAQLAKLAERPRPN